MGSGHSVSSSVSWREHPRLCDGVDCGYWLWVASAAILAAGVSADIFQLRKHRQPLLVFGWINSKVAQRDFEFTEPGTEPLCSADALGVDGRAHLDQAC
jgi:hypothetical protein